jgi:hypothetical protein
MAYVHAPRDLSLTARPHRTRLVASGATTHRSRRRVCALPAQMRTLYAHEAIPGHHFQLAIQFEMKGLPYFRKAAEGFNAFCEGWALYTERLARELGFFRTEPDGSEGYDLLVRLPNGTRVARARCYGALQKSVAHLATAHLARDVQGHFGDELMRAARLVVDTGLHYYGWSREQAMAYMEEHTILAPSDVVTEVERYCVLVREMRGRIRSRRCEGTLAHAHTHRRPHAHTHQHARVGMCAQPRQHARAWNGRTLGRSPAKRRATRWASSSSSVCATSSRRRSRPRRWTCAPSTGSCCRPVLCRSTCCQR